MSGETELQIRNHFDVLRFASHYSLPRLRPFDFSQGVLSLVEGRRGRRLDGAIVDSFVRISGRQGS
jgi:hypothetical protein